MTIIMFGKKELKELSHICAYYGKALHQKDKTLDHILPRCAGGKVMRITLLSAVVNATLKKVI